MKFGRNARLRALAGVILLVLPCACSRHEPMGGPLAVEVSFGEVGLSPGQFSYPRCMDHDLSSLWVIDKQARVQRLDPETGAYLGGWQMPEWEHGKPTGVTAWEPIGSKDGPLILIPDTHYHRVMVYDAKGTLLTKCGEYGRGPSQFIFPTDVAVMATPDGKSIARLYVSEYGENDRISVFDAVGLVNAATLEEAAARAEKGATPAWPFEYKFAFGHYGSGTGASEVEFNRPQSMEVDTARQELIVTDACNHRIGRFTLDGKLVAWINSPNEVGPGVGQFAYPYGLSLLGDGTAMVAEFGNNRVQHIDLATGTSLGIYGQTGRGEGQLATPWAVTVLGKRVYVLDSGNNRIVGFEKPRKMAYGGQGAGLAGEPLASRNGTAGSHR